jgi:hypothetical protein
MKSLNDNLREEFNEILSTPEISKIISSKSLDNDIISKAFEKLLENKKGKEGELFIEKGRAEFETLIINTLKTKTHYDDN